MASVPASVTPAAAAQAAPASLFLASRPLFPLVGAATSGAAPPPPAPSPAELYAVPHPSSDQSATPALHATVHGTPAAAVYGTWPVGSSPALHASKHRTWPAADYCAPAAHGTPPAAVYGAWPVAEYSAAHAAAYGVAPAPASSVAYAAARPAPHGASSTTSYLCFDFRFDIFFALG